MQLCHTCLRYVSLCRLLPVTCGQRLTMTWLLHIQDWHAMDRGVLQPAALQRGTHFPSLFVICQLLLFFASNWKLNCSAKLTNTHHSASWRHGYKIVRGQQELLLLLLLLLLLWWTTMSTSIKCKFLKSLANVFFHVLFGLSLSLTLSSSFLNSVLFHFSFLNCYLFLTHDHKSQSIPRQHSALHWYQQQIKHS